jgi:hypothetical protein
MTGLREPAMPLQSTSPSSYVKNLFDRPIFGRLTVVSFLGVRGSVPAHAYWQCQCECGAIRDVRGTNLLRGKTIECVFCARRTASAVGRFKRSLPGSEGAFRRLFDTYCRNAMRKGVPFVIGREAARRLFQSSCFYCGVSPSGVQKSRRGGADFVFNGIDRIDNTEGYTETNVVPCCATCNYAKRDMTAADFLAWVGRIHAHQSKRGKDEGLLQRD